MVSGMIPIPVSLRSDFIHIPGTLIHIAPESSIHIIGISTPAEAWSLMAEVFVIPCTRIYQASSDDIRSSS